MVEVNNPINVSPINRRETNENKINEVSPIFPKKESPEKTAEVNPIFLKKRQRTASIPDIAPKSKLKSSHQYDTESGGLDTNPII